MTRLSFSPFLASGLSLNNVSGSFWRRVSPTTKENTKCVHYSGHNGGLWD